MCGQALLQVGALLPMLKRGVGVHHSGLLPILKEVIEILFQENLIKACSHPLLRHAVFTHTSLPRSPGAVHWTYQPTPCCICR